MENNKKVVITFLLLSILFVTQYALFEEVNDSLQLITRLYGGNAVQGVIDDDDDAQQALNTLLRVIFSQQLYLLIIVSCFNRVKVIWRRQIAILSLSIGGNSPPNAIVNTI